MHRLNLFSCGEKNVNKARSLFLTKEFTIDKKCIFNDDIEIKITTIVYIQEQ